MLQERKYLIDLSHQINDYILQIRSICDEENAAQSAFEILQKVVNTESELRSNCGIDVRFNVIRTQLQTLLKKVENEITSPQSSLECALNEQSSLNKDEMLIYVYLFNTKGSILKTWQNLLLPSALMDHSVNRPIYVDEEHVAAMFRSKQNKEQYAYVEMVVKKKDIISSPQDKDVLRDNHGFSLARLKQGALRLENIRKFVHNGLAYSISDDLRLEVRI